MTRKGRRLVEDFLLPSLHEGKYGDLLKWEDQIKGHFSIRWSHKNAAKWTLEDTLVFQDWDRLKGRYRPEQKGYFMQAKQRFRAALYKLSTVEQLSSPDKHVKHYRLCLNKKNDMHKRMQKLVRKSENGGIPTPVICKNTLGRGTELVGRDYLEESSSNSSPISPFSIKSEDCDQAQDQIVYEEKDYQEYQNALKRQRKQSSPNHCPQEVIKTENLDILQSCVLRESPQINIARKAPHVLSQVVPVYSSKNVSRQTVENSPKSEENSTNQQAAHNPLNKQIESTQTRVESPSIFYVPTYNTPEEKDYQEYQNALKRQRKQSSPSHCPQEVIKTENLDILQSCVLRESPQINIARKAPHVLSQVVPVYSSKSVSRQTVENSPKSEENSTNQQAAHNPLNKQIENTQTRVESPSIFYVPTYNTPEEIEVAHYLAGRMVPVDAEHKKNFDGALNLSVKCDNSVLCR